MTSPSSAESDSSSLESPLSIRNSKPRKGPFEFVFIDYKGNRGRNDAGFTAQKSLMRAHVMRDYHRRQKQAKSDTLKAGLKKLPKDAPLILKPAIDTCPLGILKTHCCEGLPMAAACTECRMARLSTKEAENGPWSAKLVFKKTLGESILDPFATSSVFMTDKMNAHFMHLRTATVDACYPLNGRNMSIWWWKRAVQAPALLNALMFLCAGHIAAKQATNPKNDALAVQNTTWDSFRYRSESLRILNSVLSDPVKAVTQANILVVAAHHSVETMSANINALDAHMKGLQRLVELAGGLDKLDHLVVSKVVMSDTKGAALKQCEPVFPVCEKWKSEIIQLETINHVKDIPVDLTRTASSFLKPEIVKYFDYNFLRQLQRFRCILIYFEMAIRQPSLVKPTDNDIFIVFEHDLVCLPFDRWAFPATEIQECVRLTLLLYSNIRIWKFISLASMNIMAKYLIEAINETDFEYFLASAPELLFWVLFIASAASFGYPTRAWFLANLARVARHLHISRWEQAREVLGGFFYVDFDVVDKKAEDTWEEIMLLT